MTRQKVLGSVIYALWLGGMWGLLLIGPSPYMDGYGKALMALLFLPLFIGGMAAVISGELR